MNTLKNTHHQRGFTLIELSLAMVIGSMVALACLSMFGVMERSDRSMATRFERRSELNLTQKALQNTFSSIAMPSGRSDEQDAQSADIRLSLSSQALNQGRTQGRVQRFEVVCARAPLPGLAVRRRTSFGGELRGPVRGVWEVVTEPVLNNAGRTTGEVDYALRWRTLSIAGVPLSPPPGAEPGGEGDDTSRVMVRGLKSIQWRVFHDNERKTDYAAASVADLPAYIEMELQTKTGDYANWLFEVDWTLSEEAPEIAGDLMARLAEIEATGGDPEALAVGEGIDTDGDGEVDTFADAEGGLSDVPVVELPERFRRPSATEAARRAARPVDVPPEDYDRARDASDE